MRAMSTKLKVWWAVITILVLVYALLQHRGVRRRTSLVAGVPLALDGYLVDVEHYVLAEALFVVLLAAAVTVLLWKQRPGLLLGGATPGDGDWPGLPGGATYAVDVVEAPADLQGALSRLL